MLVEFTRAVNTEDFGDEAPTTTVNEPIAFNPVHVAAVLGNRTSAAGPECIIRLADGRGFRVVGDYPTVMTALRNGGLQS
jgi:hypothetical protein